MRKKLIWSFPFLILAFTILYLGSVPVNGLSGDDVDLKFVGGIEISGAYDMNVPEEGEVLTIIIKLENIGGSNATNVDVLLRINGMDRKTSNIRSIKAGQDDIKTVIFSWVAESGDNLIEIVIDPDNTVNETNDQFNGENNNIMTRDLSIEPMNPIHKRIDSPDGYFILFLASVLILVSIKMIKIRRFRKFNK